MKHQLPKIENLLNESFAFVDDDIYPEKQDQTVYFSYKNQQLYYLRPPISKIEVLSWIKTKSVPISIEFDELMKSLDEYEVILITNDMGSPMGYIEVHDVYKKIYNAYRYLKAYYDSIIETAEEALAVIDKNGITVEWSRGVERLYSMKKEEVIGNPVINYFPYEKLQMVRVLKTGERLHRTISRPRDDLVLFVNMSPIELDGEIVGVTCAETDISNEIRLTQKLINTTREVEQLKNEVEKLAPSNNPFNLIIGKSEAITKTIELCKKTANTSTTCLIYGESGVGKELFAKAIHNLREKPGSPFIEINCGAIPPTLFESELFGYEKGAFSGADQKGKKGKIELAKGGTLFLDEIGELPLDMQVKLLRVLQEKKYYPVGGTKELEVDFRIIAATNRDLFEMAQKGLFREDLYYRLNIIGIHIPPLRERLQDIVELTKYFLYEFSTKYNRFIKEIPYNVMEILINYPWPGNVRELRNVIERLVVFSADETILVDYLPKNLINTSQTINHNDTSIRVDLENTEGSYTSIATSLQEDVSLQEDILLQVSLQDGVDLFEKKMIMQTLSLEKGNKLETAKRLGLSRSALYYKMRKLGIE
ncbi:sigma-54 interaction domain-containing protein [Ammoniphilus sp. 3BR4]|uniref:sigma-54 interaction domain-containing protein n=1 Tax=Ammoniphilus sp. 3BR4 TaxID=3158265 RepID=UPI0034671841